MLVNISRIVTNLNHEKEDKNINKYLLSIFKDKLILTCLSCNDGMIY